MDIFRLTCVKLTTGLEKFRGVVSDDLSFASVEVEKNYWLTLPRWKSLCHRWSHDQPLPTTKGGREERPWERGWLRARVSWFTVCPANLPVSQAK